MTALPCTLKRPGGCCVSILIFGCINQKLSDITAHIRQIITHPNLSDMQPQHLGADAVGGGNMDIGPYILYNK